MTNPRIVVFAAWTRKTGGKVLAPPKPTPLISIFKTAFSPPVAFVFGTAPGWV